MSINFAADSDLLTVREVAKKLRVDDTTVRRWIKVKALECVQLPMRPGGTRGSYRIPRDAVEHLFNREA